VSSVSPQHLADNDSLILVDEEDEAIGTLPKVECHLGDGILHRAFSVFLFNDDGEVLLQQRSPDKMLWGGYWSNSCCSHPRYGEDIDDAARRRIMEELGVSSELRFLYKFQYHARFGDVGCEHELCWVFAGRYDGNPEINRDEIADWRHLSPQALTEEMTTDADRFTPWLKLEWARIREDFPDEIAT